MPKVEITETNLRHCRCPQCPVQSESKCSKNMLQKQDAAGAKKKLAQLYCSVGMSRCGDLETKETCICPSCLVWDENNLGSTYYCLRGDAKRNG